MTALWCTLICTCDVQYRTIQYNSFRRQEFAGEAARRRRLLLPTHRWLAKTLVKQMTFQSTFKSIIRTTWFDKRRQILECTRCGDSINGQFLIDFNQIYRYSSCQKTRLHFSSFLAPAVSEHGAAATFLSSCACHGVANPSTAAR